MWPLYLKFCHVSVHDLAAAGRVEQVHVIPGPVFTNILESHFETQGLVLDSDSHSRLENGIH